MDIPLSRLCLSNKVMKHVSPSTLSTLEYEDYRLDLPFALPPPEDLASATLPFPLLVMRMALRTLSTSSPVSFLAFFWRGSFSIFCMRARFATFSRSTDASVGSNCKRGSTWLA